MKKLFDLFAVVLFLSAVPCMASTSVSEVWTKHGMVHGVQSFEHGELYWDDGLALVSGEAPLPDRAVPSGILRCRRAARISLFVNCFLLSHELRGTEPPEFVETDGMLFEDVTVTCGERNGRCVAEAWIPLERILALSDP